MAEESRLVIAIDSQRAERNLRNVRSELQGVERTGVTSLNKLRTAAVAVTGALAAIGVNNIARATYDAVASSQTLMASLETVTGSAEDAQSAWKDLVDFASNTPFNLDQSVQAFIRMKSLGLNPTESALESFGNTASAMGKDMMQMVEAVADATTGEFERLKEFGIRASKDGEEVAFTFQGTTTRIQNNAAAITQYLERIGNTNFAGAMADQMDTLNGQASNLQDSIGALYRAIGDAGATDAFANGLSAASTAVQATTDALESGDLDGYMSNAANAAQMLSIVIGTRLVTAIGAATTARIRDTAASINSARAEANAAQQVTRRTRAELASARALLRTAQLEVAATRNTNAHAFALQSLSAARIRATNAAGAHATATTTATAAMGRASVAARGLSGAMALVGGPVGAAVIGAAALFTFREELGLVLSPSQAAREEMGLLAESIEDVNDATIDGAMIEMNAKLFELERRAREAREELDSLSGNRSSGALGMAPGATGESARLNAELGQISSDSSAINQEMERLKALRDGLDEAGESGSKTGDSLDRLGKTADDLAEKFKPMLNDDVESILDRAGEGSTIDEKGILRDAWGNALPSLQRELDAQLKEQINAFRSEQNLQAGLQAAAQAFISEAESAAKDAFASLMPTGDQDEAPERAGDSKKGSLNSIIPMSAEEVAHRQSAGGGDDSPKLMATKSQSSAPERASKPMGTFTIKVQKEGEGDTEGTVQGDEDFIKRMASALGGVASAV